MGHHWNGSTSRFCTDKATTLSSNAKLFGCPVCPLKGVQRRQKPKREERVEKGMQICNCSDTHNRNNGNFGITNDWDSELNFGNSQKAVVICLFLLLLHRFSHGNWDQPVRIFCFLFVIIKKTFTLIQTPPKQSCQWTLKPKYRLEMKLGIASRRKWRLLILQHINTRGQCSTIRTSSLSFSNIHVLNGMTFWSATGWLVVVSVQSCSRYSNFSFFFFWKSQQLSAVQSVRSAPRLSQMYMRIHVFGGLSFYLWLKKCHYYAVKDCEVCWLATITSSTASTEHKPCVNWGS